jgi:hypothetical protein
LGNFSGSDQSVTLKMTRVRGVLESPIALLNPENLAGGITYADGKLISASRDITETPFSISINGRTEKLTGKIILEYDQTADINAFRANETRRATMLANLVNLVSPQRQEELRNFYFLLARNFRIDDIMFRYDALMQSLRDEGANALPDLRKLETSRQDYQDRLQMFDRERTFEKRRFFLH